MIDLDKSSLIIKRMPKVKHLVVNCLPKSLLLLLQQWIGHAVFVKSGCIEPEICDYYAASSEFMLRCLVESGRTLSECHVLSLGCRVAHVADYLALFKKLLHVSMIPIEGLEGLEQINRDFFLLSPVDLNSEIDVFLSHATIHCLSDARYGNHISKGDRNGRQRPYRVAKKIKELAGERKLAVLFSAAVSDRENLSGAMCWLDDHALIRSFEEEGFTLVRTLYDKQYEEVRWKNPLGSARFTRQLPVEHLKNHPYVVGNYYFELSVHAPITTPLNRKAAAR